MKRLIIILSILAFGLSASGCSEQQTKDTQNTVDRELLFQVSTINALLAGSYDGQISIGDLKNHGDIGVGTFDALDGEMIVLDGEVYKAKYDGTVEKVDEEESTPFAAVTSFDEDQKVENVEFTDYASLQKTLDIMIKNKNLFYTFKVFGEFSHVKVRSVPSQEKPYPPLAEVIKEQAVYEYENVKGTILGFWCPDYVEGINVPGYHLHFISEDKTMGGHLLDISCKNGEIAVDQTPSFEMELPENDEFGKLVLHEDKSEELNKVEQ